MAYPSILRFTRPRTFLYVMSLRTGTELIVLTLLINKVTGVYGILALLTGLHLSPLQLSMYIYSILALLLTAYLAPYIRKQSPLQCLALAWFYVIDSIINALYTVAFGVGWFLVLMQHHSGAHKGGPGAATIDDTAGFTNPKYTVSRVDVVATPPASPAGAAVKLAPDAALVGHRSSSGANTPGVSGVLGNTILHSGSIASITVISALWAVRVYFILVVMAYARGVLRQHIILQAAPASAAPGIHDAAGGVTSAAAAGVSPGAQSAAGDASASAGRNSMDLKQIPSIASALDPHPYHHVLASPFTPPAPLSAGWAGKLGRILVSIFPSYWLGALADGEDTAVIDFGAAGAGNGGRKSADAGPPGVFERERRRRAGTGPPMLKPIELAKVSK